MENELLYEEQEAAPEVVEQEEQIPEEPEEPEIVERPTPQQSWKELRQKAAQAEKLEKERDQYFNMLKQIEQEALKYQQQQATSNQPEPEEEFDYNNLPDDDLIEGKQLKKILLQEQKRRSSLEQNLKLQQKYAQEAAVEAALKSRYTDFYEVVTPENITSLRESEPDIAESLNLNPNLEKKAVGVYNAIKKLGIYQANQYTHDKQMAQKNASKPRPLNSISPQNGGTPLDQANAFAGGLTKELKAKLYADMKAKAGGY